MNINKPFHIHDILDDIETGDETPCDEATAHYLGAISKIMFNNMIKK